MVVKNKIAEETISSIFDTHTGICNVHRHLSRIVTMNRITIINHNNFKNGRNDIGSILIVNSNLFFIYLNMLRHLIKLDKFVKKSCYILSFCS